MGRKKFLFLLCIVSTLAHGNMRTFLAGMKAVQDNNFAKAVASLGAAPHAKKEELAIAILKQFPQALDLPILKQYQVSHDIIVACLQKSQRTHGWPISNQYDVWRSISSITSHRERAKLLAHLYKEHSPSFRIADLEHYLRLTIALPPEERVCIRQAEEFMRQQQLRHAQKAKNDGHPRIAIVSLYDDGYFDVGIWSDLNKWAYAKKHGYDLYLYHKLFADKRPASWHKIPAIFEVLDTYDWVFWSDADALFMNDKIRLESFIDGEGDMIVCLEFPDPYILNCGNFFIKNSERAHYILNAMWADKYPWPPGASVWQGFLWEQGAFLTLLKNEPVVSQWLKILPMRAFNSHPVADPYKYEPGDFLLHFFGDCGKASGMKQAFHQSYKP